MKYKSFIFLILLFFIILTGCYGSKEETSVVVEEYPLINLEIKKAINSGNPKSYFSIFHYYYEGKVIAVTPNHIDFQNDDLVIRTRISTDDKIIPQIGHSYKFLGSVSKSEYDALFMNVSIKDEISDVKTMSHSNISYKEDLINNKGTRFELSNVRIDDIKYFKEEINPYYVICFKAGNDTIGIKQEYFEDDLLIYNIGDLINLKFNNFVKEYDALAQNGIDYLLSDYDSIFIN